ncbi:ataxin-10-like protein [Dermatophagoides farinae]|uniref:Ataxin-10-like protein n=1 Tax=Dermatophagoides farinae TaxID=6954 RepID=A0A9D4P2Q1_DERFA|nr:ataxin-10-like [Dermatophagoides farinae]KAH7642537.1 ataxin-10-like protein [Dermatophagoides farinae]
MTNVDVNDSMTLLRNSIASATCIDNVNFRCQFFRIICDEKYLFIKSIQSFFDRQFDDLYTKLVSNSIVENDDVSLMFMLKSLQFFFNLSNLNPQQFEFKNFSEFHSFILNKKYYKFLNFYKLEKSLKNDHIQYLLKRLTIVYTALLFRCLSNDTVRMNGILNETMIDTSFWNPLFDHIESELSEWSLWIFFLVLKDEKFAKNLFCTISTKRQIIFLDICMEFIDDECRKHEKISMKNIETIEPDDCLNLFGCQLCPLPKEFIEFINQLFHHQINEYFLKSNFDDNSHHDDLLVFTKISSFLLKIISFQSYAEILKKQDLFENLLDILSCFHTMSNDPESIFYTQDLRTSGQQKSSLVENQPIFGFKRNIIGLIANCLHENFHAQTQLRTSGRFIALLNSTKIDRNNPFILQWTIFAIRNALKDNIANQEFVRNLQKQTEIFDNEIFDKIKFIR